MPKKVAEVANLLSFPLFKVHFFYDKSLIKTDRSEIRIIFEVTEIKIN